MHILCIFIMASMAYFFDLAVFAFSEVKPEFKETFDAMAETMAISNGKWIIYFALVMAGWILVIKFNEKKGTVVSGIYLTAINVLEIRYFFWYINHLVFEFPENLHYNAFGLFSLFACIFAWGSVWFEIEWIVSKIRASINQKEE